MVTFICIYILPFKIGKTLTTLYMTLKMVAPWGRLQVVAETCRSIVNQIVVQLVGAILVYVLQITSVHVTLKTVCFKCTHHARLQKCITKLCLIYGRNSLPYKLSWHEICCILPSVVPHWTGMNMLTANTKSETIWSLKRMPAGIFLNCHNSQLLN